MKSKDIAIGYTLYEDGRVWSHKSNRYLKTRIHHGYPVVKMSFGAKNQKEARLHTLLAEEFIPNPHNSPFVLHKDGNRLNFKLDNLYWGWGKNEVRNNVDKLATCGNIKSKYIEGGYTLYEDGRVYSHKSNRYLKSFKEGGYPAVKMSFRSDGFGNYKLHKLLAEAFIDNPDNKPFVLHKDDDRLNFKLDNLYWGNYNDNAKDYWDNGKRKRATYTFLTDTGEQVTTNNIPLWCKERDIPQTRLESAYRKGQVINTTPGRIDKWGNRR